MRIARAAGAAIEAVHARFDARDDARHKADGSPVTEADLAADRVISDALRRVFPDDAIVSEESRDVGGTSGATWVVDPLDGTEAFIGGQRGYAVQIARVVDGAVTHAVVYESRFDELFWAAAGEGAWLVRGAEQTRLATRCATEGLRVVTSPRVDPGFRATLMAHGLLDGGMFRSVGVKVGRIVQGLADVYLATHGLSVWDVAAPYLVLVEAGGRMTDLDGNPPVFRPRALANTPAIREYHGPLLATHGPTHDHWCAVLRTLRREAIHARGARVHPDDPDGV